MIVLAKTLPKKEKLKNRRELEAKTEPVFYFYGSLPAHCYTDEQGFGDSVGP